MKKTVVLCDVCKSRVADKKCSICDKDLCGYCQYTAGINIADTSITFGTSSSYEGKIVICSDCRNKVISIIHNMNGIDEDDFMKILRLFESMAKINVL